MTQPTLANLLIYRNLLADPIIAAQVDAPGVLSPALSAELIAAAEKFGIGGNLFCNYFIYQLLQDSNLVTTALEQSTAPILASGLAAAFRQSRKVADLRDWWNGQKHIKLLDPNITACSDFFDLMGQLEESRACVDFTQGLDIRLMTEEKAAAINRVRHKTLHFAWDDPKDEVAYRKLEQFRNVWKVHESKRVVYVLTNFNSTHEEDLTRVEMLRSIGYEPYIMIYDKPNSPKITRKLQRYVNNKIIFRSARSFDEYNG